ncbi:MAG: quinolinate synthase NadA [Candidatus Sumerlaeia bacterium]|nr:quinolinate synthase NadA [Candidatus Sumerlaeia bacterium]
MEALSTLAVDIDPRLDLFEEIARLKRRLNAVILAHFYQDPDIQDVADFVEDSLGLARRAQATQADVIVFCGVHFMAETAKILNPGKQVLMPDLRAGCSLSDSCPPPLFAAFKAAHPGHIVISYINCSAGIKALSDIIVTSTNAEKIVRQIPAGQPIIFAPDKNLGAHIAKVTGREMLLWSGACMVHEIFSEKKLRQLKVRYPRALVLAHPECEEPVLRLADHIGSTSSILSFAKTSPAQEFIIVTEPGLIHTMEKQCPGKRFIPAPPDHGCACNECPHMKLNTLEKLYLCMHHRAPEIVMDEETRLRALRPIERMLAMS